MRDAPVTEAAPPPDLTLLGEAERPRPPEDWRLWALAHHDALLAGARATYPTVDRKTGERWLKVLARPPLAHAADTLALFAELATGLQEPRDELATLAWDALRTAPLLPPFDVRKRFGALSRDTRWRFGDRLNFAVVGALEDPAHAISLIDLADFKDTSDHLHKLLGYALRLPSPATAPVLASLLLAEEGTWLVRLLDRLVADKALVPALPELAAACTVRWGPEPTAALRARTPDELAGPLAAWAVAYGHASLLDAALEGLERCGTRADIAAIDALMDSEEPALIERAERLRAALEGRPDNPAAEPVRLALAGRTAPEGWSFRDRRRLACVLEATRRGEPPRHVDVVGLVPIATTQLETGAEPGPALELLEALVGRSLGPELLLEAALRPGRACAPARRLLWRTMERIGVPVPAATQARFLAEAQRLVSPDWSYRLLVCGLPESEQAWAARLRDRMSPTTPPPLVEQRHLLAQEPNAACLRALATLYDTCNTTQAAALARALPASNLDAHLPAVLASIERRDPGQGARILALLPPCAAFAPALGRIAEHGPAPLARAARSRLAAGTPQPIPPPRALPALALPTAWLIGDRDAPLLYPLIVLVGVLVLVCGSTSSLFSRQDSGMITGALGLLALAALAVLHVRGALRSAALVRRGVDTTARVTRKKPRKGETVGEVTVELVGEDGALHRFQRRATPVDLPAADAAETRRVLYLPDATGRPRDLALLPSLPAEPGPTGWRVPSAARSWALFHAAVVLPLAGGLGWLCAAVLTD
jgi:hypothetical protein